MNKLKRVLTGTLALAMAASMMAACGKDDSSTGSNGGNGGDGNKGDKTVFHVYTFTEETEKMINIFLEDNPDIAEKYTFEYSMRDKAAEHIQQVASDLPQNMIDLFVADADYAQQFANFENTATLKDLGIEVNAADYYEYTLNFTKNAAGEMTALSHQAAPGAVFYRRSIAKEVLGSDDPATVQAAMSDWDKFLDLADQVKEKAGRPMICGIDELKRTFMNNRDGAWIKDGEFYCDTATFTKFLEVTKTLADKDEVHYKDSAQWTDNWNSDMADVSGEGPFCFFGCTWYLHYTIKPNSLANADDGEVVGNGTYGDWGMVAGPMPYFWGGTWWYGSKNAAADEGKKEVVKKIIEYFCANDDTMKAYMEETGDFPSKPGVAAQLSTSNDFLGGQDHFAIFREAAPGVKVDTCTQYDDTFNTATNNALVAYVVKGSDIDTVLADLEAEAKTAIEELN